MKNKVLLIFAALLSLPGFSQVIVDDVDINSLDIKYCEIVGTNRALVRSRIVVNIDYGQQMGYSDKIKNAEGKAVIFNSMIDALNFMEKNGWEYVDSYALSYSNTNMVYHYLLRRKTNTPQPENID